MGRQEFETLVAEFQAPLGRFLHQIIKDRSAAEDLLQETFAVAWRERGELGRIRDPRAWLYGIARNRALAALRKRRRTARLTAQLFAHRSTDSVSVDDESDAVAVRDFLIRHLDADDRALIVLRYLHGFNSGELAAMIGASPAAIRQRLSRACRRLESALEASEGGREGRT